MQVQGKLGLAIRLFKRGVRVAVATAATLTLVSGCAAGIPSQPSADETTAEPKSDAAAEASVADDDLPSSNRARYLALDSEEQDNYLRAVIIEQRLVWGTHDNDTAVAEVERDRHRIAQVEEAVAACMIAQGFDYFPEPADQQRAPGTDPEFDGGTREWTEHFGFGISTFIVFDNGQLPDGVHGYRGEFLNVRDFDEAPNEQYLASLSEQVAYDYQVALAGPPPDEGGAVEDYDPATAPGCYAEAERAVPQTPSVYEQPADISEDLRQRSLADRAWVDYEQSLSECVSELGYQPFPGFDAVAPMFLDELEAERVIPSNEIPSNEIPSSVEDDDNLSLLIPDSPEYYSALRRVQELEREYAVAVYDCGGDRQAQQKLLAEIIHRLIQAEG